MNIIVTKYPKSLEKLDFVAKPLPVMCSYMSDDQQTLCAKFNPGLKLIKMNDKYQKIIMCIQNLTSSTDKQAVHSRIASRLVKSVFVIY
ncbi:MAG: hypothetical protein ACI845_004345, partial [Gammaproteobacteria bacterium]